LDMVGFYRGNVLDVSKHNPNRDGEGIQ